MEQWQAEQRRWCARNGLLLAAYEGGQHAVGIGEAVRDAALACLRRSLPSFHYMVAVAVAGGDDVPCAPYHLFGTQALSAAVATAFAERDACLMANHGLVAGGDTLARAMKLLQEIESLCEVYLKALAVGEPALLTRAQMDEVIERFKGYGQAAARTR